MIAHNCLGYEKTGPFNREAKVSNIHNHIKKLQDEHHALDREIERMENTGQYDDIAMQALKKKKLHLKDEIAKLEHDAATQHKAQG